MPYSSKNSCATKVTLLFLDSFRSERLTRYRHWIGHWRQKKLITQKSELMKTLTTEERKDLKATLCIAGALIAAQALAFIYVLTQ
jgi:hypothetical protein